MCLSSDGVTCVAFKPDNPNIVVSGSYDETIKTWDITSGSCLSTLNVGYAFSNLVLEFLYVYTLFSLDLVLEFRYKITVNHKLKLTPFHTSHLFTNDTK